MKYLIYILILSFFSCTTPKKKSKVLFQEKDYSFPYNLQQPEQVSHLKKNLHEISGLSYQSEQKLVAIQDEKGILFILNTQKGNILKEIKFAKNGDYEGVEIVNKDAWVVKSNGDLYQIKNFKNDSLRKTVKHTTPLSGHNDVEGLAYNSNKHQLLIACKGYPFLKKTKKGKFFKAVYQYDISKNKLIKKPYLLLTLDSLKKFKNYSKVDKLGIELVATIDEAEGDPTLQPSAITINPISKNIYMLSSVGKLLLVLDKNGNLLTMIRLDKKIHPQPEGICFSPSGTLYISNEGKKHSKATLIQYLKK